jgi:hypothetical protein
MRVIDRVLIHVLVAAAAALIGLAAGAAPPPGSSGFAADLSGSSWLFVSGFGKREDRTVGGGLLFAAGEWLASDDDGESYSGSFQRGVKKGKKNTFYFSYDAAGREAVERVVASWVRERLLAQEGIDTEVVVALDGGSATGRLKKKGKRFIVTGKFPFTATAPELGQSRSGTYSFKVSGPVRAVVVGEEPWGDARVVDVIIEGAGRVTGVGFDFACDAVCRFYADEGAAFLLEAEPSQGRAFQGWSGCDEVEGRTCTFLVTSERRVTASFGSGLSAQTRITSLPTSGLAGYRFRMSFECVGPVCTHALGLPVFTIQWKFFPPGGYPTGAVDWSSGTRTIPCDTRYACSASGSTGEILWPNPVEGYWCFRVKDGPEDSVSPYSTERCIDLQPQ